MTWEILCQDSLKWLAEQPDASLPNIVTGLPDQDELKLDMSEYLEYFRQAAHIIFQKVSRRGYAIFVQTDRKFERQWIDKSYILSEIARKAGLKMIWHKIVLRRPLNSTYIQRPTYSHMLCYSDQGSPGSAVPDVIEGGKVFYDNGAPVNAARLIVDFLVKMKQEAFVDPFVGRGTFPFFGVQAGLHVIGLDIDPEQCQKTREKLLPGSARE